MACASPAGWLVGLDFEVGADTRVRLAKRVCTPERAIFHGLNPEQNTQARDGTFGAIWTLKEALLKAYRVGLVNALDDIRTGALPEGFIGEASVTLASAVDPRIPWPLSDALWAGITRWEQAPLAAVATRDDRVM